MAKWLGAERLLTNDSLVRLPCYYIDRLDEDRFILESYTFQYYQKIMQQEHYSRIFLLSHMRAYTSLLGHVLGSHPEINGYYEMHINYLTAQDLLRQEQQYALYDNLKPGSRFLFDKLLHNDYALELEQLNMQDAAILMALREPNATIKSIVNLFTKKDTPHLYASAFAATQYYIERLNKLSEFCHQNAQRYFYFDAALIYYDTANFLAILSHWLQLNTVLKESYHTFAKTGVAGAGDSSPEISSGKIIRQRQKKFVIELSDELLNMARSAYIDCRCQLITNATAYAITRIYP